MHCAVLSDELLMQSVRHEIGHREVVAGETHADASYASGVPLGLGTH
jgi:hypothetical protein